MPLWGNKNQPVTANLTTTHESTEGAPIGTYVHVKGDQIDRKGSANAHAGNTVPGSRARTDFDMFESSIFNEFQPTMAVGVYGVYANSGDLTSEQQDEYNEYVTNVHVRKKHLKKHGTLPDGEQLKYRIINPGCGYSGGMAGRPVPVRLYFANGYLDDTSVHGDIYFSGVISPPDPNNGKVKGYTVVNELFVDEPPNADIDPPENFYIACNNSQLFPPGIAIDYAQANFGIGDKIFYYVPSGNTPIQPLTGNTYYYISDINVQYLSLSDTLGGQTITITDPRINSEDPFPEQHTIQGEQAQIEAYIETANNIGASHAGWVLRREFRGGRLGRVQTECLVAMSSLQEGVIPPGEPEPVVYDIDPYYGTEFGGDTIAITGENFISFDPESPYNLKDTYVTRVLFGNVFANDATVSVANNTYLTVVTPKANKPETVDVRVQTGYGISRTNPKAKFTYYITEPYIKAVQPNRGGYKGQTNVNIGGFNFGSTTRVQFGNNDALSFEVITNEYIKAVSPPGSNGTVNIIVTGANGASDPDPTSEFTYYSAIPVVDELLPANGPMDPVTVTIKGSNFIQYGAKYQGDTSVLNVYFGQQEANIISIASDSSVVVDPPQVLVPGTVDVIVRNTYGNSIPNANSKFTYYAEAPTVSNANPKFVSAYEPTKITVTGQNLWLAYEVSYGATVIRNGIDVSPDGTSLTFTTVPGAVDGYKQITVTTPSGRTPEYYDCGIDLITIPYVTYNEVQAYDMRGNTSCTIKGLNFDAPGYQEVVRAYYQRFDTYPSDKKLDVVNLNVVNNSTIEFRVPNFYNAGFPTFQYYTIILEANNGLKSSNTAPTKVYIDNWTPQVNRIDPKIGPIKGFTEIYCYGRNFAQSIITYGQWGEGPSGIPGKSKQVVNDSVMIVVAPTVAANQVGSCNHILVYSVLYGFSSVSPNNEFSYTNNSGTIQSFTLNYPGCGYNANRPIKITARLFSNGMMDNRAGIANCDPFEASATHGKIVKVTANSDFPVLFRGFDNTPVIEIDPPEKYSFPANTSGFGGYPSSNRTWFLNGVNKIFSNGDRVLYSCQGPGGPLKPLQNQTYYYVTQVDRYNVTDFKIAATKEDALANIAINIYDTRLAQQIPTDDISFLQGETANLSYTLVP